MMISPEMYIETLKDMELKELIEERKLLLRDIRRFERDKYSSKDKQLSLMVHIKPSPEVVYQMNNEYLIKITELINKKFNAEVNN